VTGTYRFKLGKFDCLVLSDNTRVETVGQMIAADVPPGELSAVLRDLGYPSDELQVGYNCLLVNTGERRVLVDTGSGRGQLLQNLQAAGLGPEDIDTIVLTHGDGDHIGGIVDEQGQLTFPKARYVMWTQAWSLWTQADTRAHLVEQFLVLMRRRGISGDELAQMAEGRATYGTRTLPLIRERVDLVEPETEFLPGFQIITATGHRSDHIALAISSAGEQLLHIVDAARHPIQMARPEWYGTIDSFAQETVETRRRLLQRAAAGQALIFGAHLTFPGLGYVRQQGAGWSWQAVA
jgi:glyoxylase-like metal-dependent hydrolase (beta-lactamase superfamily II)